MIRYRIVPVILLGLCGWVAMESSALAGRGRACCEVDYDNCVGSRPQMIERTIYVPEYSTEKRIVRRVECRPVQKERVVTFMERVPETKTVEQSYTVLERRERSRTVYETVSKPVYETKTREFQIQVPYWETKQVSFQVQVPVRRQVEQTYVVNVRERQERQGTRQVCQYVPVTETRSVTCDNGHWEMRTAEVSCDSSGRRGRRRACCDDDCCGVVTVCQRVWVPQVETKQVEVTMMRPKMSEVPYTYTVVVNRPETKTRMVSVCNYETQTRTRDVKVCKYRPETRTQNYQTCRLVSEERPREIVETYCVPVTKTRNVNVTTYKCVPREKTVTYTALERHEVEQEIEVPVCRTVAKKIVVPASANCDDCGSGRGRRFFR